jgi:hypothetical protein
MADFIRKLFGFKGRADDWRDSRIADRAPVRSAWQVEDDGRLATRWRVRGSD